MNIQVNVPQPRSRGNGCNVRAPIHVSYMLSVSIVYFIVVCYVMNYLSVIFNVQANANVTRTRATVTSERAQLHVSL